MAEGMRDPSARIEMLDGFNSSWIDFDPTVEEHIRGSTPYEVVLRTLGAK